MIELNGIALTRADLSLGSERFDKRRLGLHHICFRLRSREDIDRLGAAARDRGIAMIREPEEGEWAPG